MDRRAVVEWMFDVMKYAEKDGFRGAFRNGMLGYYNWCAARKVLAKMGVLKSHGRIEH